MSLQDVPCFSVISDLLTLLDFYWTLGTPWARRDGRDRPDRRVGGGRGRDCIVGKKTRRDRNTAPRCLFNKIFNADHTKNKQKQSIVGSMSGVLNFACVISGSDVFSKSKCNRSKPCASPSSPNRFSLASRTTLNDPGLAGTTTSIKYPSVARIFASNSR